MPWHDAELGLSVVASPVTSLINMTDGPTGVPRFICLDPARHRIDGADRPETIRAKVGCSENATGVSPTNQWLRMEKF